MLTAKNIIENTPEFIGEHPLLVRKGGSKLADVPNTYQANKDFLADLDWCELFEEDLDPGVYVGYGFCRYFVAEFQEVVGHLGVKYFKDLTPKEKAGIFLAKGHAQKGMQAFSTSIKTTPTKKVGLIIGPKEVDWKTGEILDPELIVWTFHPGKHMGQGRPIFHVSELTDWDVVKLSD
jgi:hypothetical protein